MKHWTVLLCVLLTTAAVAQKPVMTLDFETVKDGKAIESATQIADSIEGHFEQAAGVRGKGLRYPRPDLFRHID